MKIKKHKHYKTNEVIVEFDEFFDMGVTDRNRIEEIISYMDTTGARRLAYNIWQFKTESEAKNSLFILGLKT